MTNAPANPEATVAPAAWRSTTLWTVMVLMVIYTLTWLGTALVLKHQAAAWITLQHANGLKIETSALDMGGFPGRVRIAMRDVTVTAPGWTWHTDKVRLTAWPFGLWRPTIDMSGRQSFAGVVTPADVPVWLTADRMDIALKLDLAGRLRDATLIAAGVDAGILEAQPLLHLQTGTVALNLLPSDALSTDVATPALPATSRIAVDLQGLALPFPLPAPLDQPIARAAATVEITGPITPGPLPQVLEAWRSAGGTVEVRSAALDWPPLHVSGSGTAALDEHLQPEGAFSLKFHGGSETLDAFANGGWMGKDEAGVAKFGLALLSRTGTDGATTEINVPLTIQERRLSAGPVTVMTIPEIVWRHVEAP